MTSPRLSFSVLVAVAALHVGPSAAVARGQDLAQRAPRFLFASARGDAAPFEIDVSSSARLSRVISLRLEQPTVGRLLREVERQTGLKFYYAPDVLSPDRPVLLRADAISVATALVGILMDAGVDVLMSDGRNIALVKKRATLVELPALGTISGRVTDQGGGLAIESAQIRVEGTSLGTVSDDSGRFTIRGVPAGEQRLTARRVAYAPMTKTVSVTDGGTAQADFALQRVATQLAEVVTTVTGGQARYELGSTVANLRADSVLKETPLQHLSDLLANRVPGAVINAQNGFTGTVSPIRLRGLNSFTVSNNPIVIVDGTRIESAATGQGVGGNSGGSSVTNGSARLGDLNLNEIESVEVVKGPSAATLYGTDAANGVLIIKTKRGQPGHVRWDMYGELGSLKQNTSLMPTAHRGWGHSPSTGAQVAPCALASVAAGACILDSISRFSPLKNDQTSFLAPGRQGVAGLQVSGGASQFRYMVAGGWENEVGWARMPLVEQERIKQVQGLASIPDEHLRPNTERKVNLRANATADWGTRGDLTLSNALVRQKFRQLNPFSFVIAYLGTGYNDPTSHGYRLGDQIGDQFQVKTADELTRYISSLTGNYRPTNWLATRATLGVDYSNDVVDNLQMNGQGPPGLNRTGRRVLGSNAITQYTFDAGATATQALAATFMSKTSAGLQYNRRSQLYGAQTGVGLPPGSTTMSGAGSLTSTELRADAIVAGAYVEQEIGWRDRLFVTAAVRADGASTFGRDLNTALYPKFGVSWLASEESAVQKIPGISSLRLRAAFGSSGVQPPSTASVTTLTLVTGAVGGASTSGVVPGAFGNPKIGPERQTEFEGGLDLEAWNGRIRTELTGYARRSTDALIQIPIAVSAGGGSIYQNIGSVTNRGIEGLLTVRPIDGPRVSLSLTANGSANKNRLVSTFPNAPPGYFQTFGLLGQRHRVGYPLYGVWQKPIVSYADANGDGIIALSEIVVGDTEVYMGPTSATKRLAFGGTLSLARDLVRLTAMFDWQGGHTPLSYDKFIQCNLTLNCAGNVVRGTQTLGEQASIQAYNKASSLYGFVGDGAFTRFRELAVSARLPRQVLRATRANAASISLSGRNLHVWTNWLAGDPEVNYNTGSDQTLTYSSPPLPRTFIARLNLSY
jgi:TonB-linked SusC/RagA family outer membrane protein